MSALGLKCLELVTGLIAEKMRKVATSRLKGGDVTDDSFRDLLLKDLDKIRDQLDGLSRVDLLAGVNFFKTGMELLYSFVMNSSKPTNEQQEKKDQAELSGDGKIDISALLELFGGVDGNNSKDATMKVMKQKFELAGEYSTRAFSNEALDVEDRVIASSFRVHSALLRHLDNPDICVVLLKNYVEQLNSIPSVVNTFEVQFSGGNIARMKKAFNSERRKALVRSVVAVNRVVYGYILLLQPSVSGLNDPIDKSSWLFIDISDSDHRINVITDPRVRKVCQQPLRPNNSLNCPQDVAVSSNGIIIVADTCNHEVKFFTTEGTYLSSCEPVSDPKTGINTTQSYMYNSSNFWPTCVDVDQNGNIYVGSSRRRRQDRNLQSEIVIFQSNGKSKHRFPNNDVLNTKSILTSMSVDLQGRVLVIDDHGAVVLVFSSDGKFLFKFGDWHDQEGYSHIATTSDGTAMVTLWNHVNIYDKEGKLLRKVPMSDHGLPIAGITHDHRKEQTTVLCKSYEHIAHKLHTEDTPNLQIYSECWELLAVVPLPKEYHSAKGIATRFDGLVVVANVDDNELLMI